MAQNQAMGPRSKFRWVMGLVAVPILVVAAYTGRFFAFSVCPKCGLIRNTTEWQIPLLEGVTLFSTHQYQPSALSTALDECGLQKAHAHQWMFAQGSGNGIICALGRGGHIFIADQRPWAANLVKLAHQHGDTALVEDLLKTLASPKQCQLVEELAREAYFEKLSDTSHFHAWLDQHADEVKAIRKAAATPP